MEALSAYPVTLVIILITAGVSLLSMENREAKAKFMLNPYTVKHNREYWRLITHGVLHADFMHLAFNMFVFYFFGSNLEQFMTNPYFFQAFFPGQEFWGVNTGRILFVALYVGSIVFATLPGMRKHGDNIHYNSLGASGAVSGVLLASIMLDPLNTIYLFGVIGMPGFIAGILFFVGESYQNKRGRTNVAHDAHIWGAIFGVVAITLIDPSVLLRFFSAIVSWFGGLFGG